METGKVAAPARTALFGEFERKGTRLDCRTIYRSSLLKKGAMLFVSWGRRRRGFL